MAYKVKGPHTFTLGYEGKSINPILVQPGQDLPADVTEVDLRNLARNNNLTDSNGADYDVVIDEKSGLEKLVKVGKDSEGNVELTEVNGTAVTTGQPDASTIENDPQLNEGNDPSANSGQAQVVGA